MTRLFRVGAAGAVLPPAVFRALRSGGMVVYPTDTLYGLGVDPGSAAALRALVSVKGRRAGKPVPLLLDDPGRAWSFAAEVPEAAARLMGRFWPGALTIVLPASPRLPPPVRGVDGTVGLRVPDHPVPRALAAALGGAVTGTSANRSGGTGMWREPAELLREFTGAAEWVLWAGPPGTPREGAAAGSTVVSLAGGRARLIREGDIPFRTVQDFLREG